MENKVAASRIDRTGHVVAFELFVEEIFDARYVVLVLHESSTSSANYEAWDCLVIDDYVAIFIGKVVSFSSESLEHGKVSSFGNNRKLVTSVLLRNQNERSETTKGAST